MFFSAVIMGLVEGITEFLPISSTGHLIIMDEVLNFQGPPGKTFEICIQLGAIMAVCWLFRQKIWHVIRHLPHDRESQLFTLNLIVAFLPAGVIGLAFHHFITAHLFNVWVVATTMFAGGFAIIAIEKWKPAARISSLESITPRTAFLVGLCQCLAMIPGVSRSGATIMGALVFGVERKTAAEFSFFLAIPTMFAATLFDLYKNRADLTADGFTQIAIGFVVAFISGLLVVKWFMTYISRHGFLPFAFYRIIAGGILFATLVMR
jgi:undecaprenyl-diphosphatase